ncbi:PLP-dependent aminotransferase family protein [Streptomyces sp. NBC_00377]|uniref:MocR-like transcription factor YczR n=1 Tax=unclassified Streptomyces TaxID=2593676 RepID=UPI002E245A43|nr:MULTISPECIES: PLP-dependent aminotransferase family protein [unclassified Streptomyces]
MNHATRALSGRQLAALLPDLKGVRPAYRQLSEAIRALILDGQVALHIRLPAERALATALNLSRPTVTASYDLLRAGGYAHSRQGSGTWTALPKEVLPHKVARALPPSDTTIDLARAAPGLPSHVLAEALGRVAPQLAVHTRSSGYHPYGLPELRAAVADRFTRRGLATVPEQILITSGAQHALTLVLGLLAAPGDRMMVENPSYPNALEAMRRARLRTVSVPVSDHGWDVEVLEATLRQTVPQLAFLMPDFHNPTGLLMPDEDRVRVLRAARPADSWLVIDETTADLALDLPAPRPFASHAAPGGSGRVITIGSMSKTHWGGLRIGWLRAPARLVTELAAQRIATDLGGSVLDQLLAHALLSGAEDLLPSHLARVREQRDALAGALTEHFPQWRWQLPPGGLSLWVDLGEPIASTLAERTLEHGVRIEGGACFTTDPGVFENRLRIPYTRPSDILREAVQRMAAAVTRGLRTPSADRRPHWVV